MNRTAKLYAISVATVGSLLGAYCTAYTVNNIKTASDSRSILTRILLLFILCYFCRCFPIYLQRDLAIDMGFISYYATVLCVGPQAATAIIFISSFIIVEHSPDKTKKIITFFNTPLLKSMFNNANFCISVYCGGLIYQRTGGVIADLSIPDIIIPSMMMLFVTMAINSILLIVLFKISSDIPFFSSFVKNLLEFLPSMIAAAPIGYFIARFLTMDNGEYLVLFFVLPLLLARYAFSLYIESKRNYYVMLKTLTLAIEAKDEYTCGHSQRVEEYASRIATEMNLSKSRIENLRVAALLHDVGKIGIDESILNKPTKLTPIERKQIERHPQISVDILKEVNLSPIVFQIILHHHERYDGRGYPSGMGGSALPIEVYILSVADTYDAITSTRPYSYGSSPERAKEIIMEESGAQFHPAVVEAFLRAFDAGKMTLVDRKPESVMLSV